MMYTSTYGIRIQYISVVIELRTDTQAFRTDFDNQ